MDTFRWMSTVFSLILGLGVARILLASIALFRARGLVRIDWLPCVWAAIIFLQQITFWWSIEELATTIPRWTFPNFLLLVSLVLTLFLAAASILPSEGFSSGSLRDFFERDGRWGLVALAAFNAIAIALNALFWRIDILSGAELLNLGLVVLPLVAFAGRRKIQISATLLYVPLGLFGVMQLVPMSY
ncbi:hypothetical protein SAMN02745157_3639 [Kaistia soli DSM 19436]|uniref:Uncharacterized protein n=1 Tax=Kaistia soli DSM 19436 TaxID=1122133 RepID=A0A1M5H5Y7_9HYPH|nr:hypothetical protein [Kaistia soli]SHG11420.1 hypothetical protein SAMN02745157_3639 [Kaistia soli DSM 19436]